MNNIFKRLTIYPKMSVRLSEAYLRSRQRNTHYECQIAADAATLKEILSFRAEVFSESYGVYFNEGIDVDAFDQDSIHFFVRDVRSRDIVACTRVITPEAKKRIGQYYSESEFNLDSFLRGKDQIYEIGRTCVSPSLRGGRVLAILWMGMVPLMINSLHAKYLIGTVSVNLSKPDQKLIATTWFIQHKARTINIPSLKIFNIKVYFVNKNRASKEKQIHRRDIPSLFEKYHKLGAIFSKEAFHDEAFNCVDYFVSVKVSRSLQWKLRLVCTVIDWVS